YTGVPQPGTHYLTETHASLAVSPSNGSSQSMNASAPSSIAATLPAPAVASVTRFLINGKIVVGSNSLKRVGYLGDAIEVDTLSEDGNTTVEKRMRHGIVKVPLSGAVASAPTELAQNLNSLYFNPALLSATATWKSGAAYLRYQQLEMGDCYTVIDYAAATTGSLPTPVASNTTIAVLMLKGGIYSSADAKTYKSTDGVVGVVNGVNMFVASAARPNLTTTEYRIYFELNGNVYDGSLIKANTDVGGNSYPVASSTATSGYVLNYSQNYRILFNQAAVDSIHAALTF
ncbi:hypothetical protein, partial [Caballeronia zhejiangensis]